MKTIMALLRRWMLGFSFPLVAILSCLSACGEHYEARRIHLPVQSAELELLSDRYWEITQPMYYRLSWADGHQRRYSEIKYFGNVAPDSLPEDVEWKTISDTTGTIVALMSPQCADSIVVLIDLNEHIAWPGNILSRTDTDYRALTLNMLQRLQATFPERHLELWGEGF